MTSALIGYTGFVGSTLCGQTRFDDLYNSTNISSIRGKNYDLVVCAGAPAAKWKANQDPELDWANLQMLMGHLDQVKADKFILISTVDVFQMPPPVDEATLVDETIIDHYGRHRARLEGFVYQIFPNLTIIRLPGLFGKGLRKNFIFDLLNTGHSQWTDFRSRFQFYDMARLWDDVNRVRQSSVNLIHFATEPVTASDVALKCFDLAFQTTTEKPPVLYDMRTRHAALFGGTGYYMMSATEVFQNIRAYVNSERASSDANSHL
jgi:dTDP-4-dehydrorhamnose reductase